MRVLTVFNKRRVWGGEDRMVDMIRAILEANNHSVVQWVRSNDEFEGSLAGRARVFVSGVYSRAAARAMRARICDERPDVVHAHNVYPLFSPSIAAACEDMLVPMLLHLHSFVLTCPTTFHLRDGALCDSCLGGREYACALHNCRGNLAESVAYATRAMVARTFGLFTNHVTRFLAVSQFCCDWLVDAGYPEDRITVVPNAVSIPSAPGNPRRGEYVAFAGRLSPEKGIDVLFEAARRSALPIVIAADTSAAAEYVAAAPPNVRFAGQLGRSDLDRLYRHARFVVVPSIWREPFGLVAAEALAHGVPVIASRIGALPEITEHEKTGLTVPAGDPDALSAAMTRLWRDPGECGAFGAAGRDKAVREYHPAVYHERLINAYQKAMEAVAARHAAVPAGAAL
jgi:glycosyltransferase involved in cell wall biosynthesis